jgi:D-hydroxyproline dehydrogenase
MAWVSRREPYERGVRALSSLQHTAARDLAALLDHAGAAKLVHLDGHLMLVERAGSIAAAQAEVGYLREHGVRSEWIPTGDVKALAPEIAAPLVGAWRFGGTGHVDDPYAVSRALEGALRSAGGEVVQATIARIDGDGGAFVAHASDGRRFEGTHVVLACGAFSKPLAAQLGYDVPLETERGYHLTLPAAFPSFRIPVSSFERKAIMTPMTCGLRMTSTVELGGLELPPDARRFELMRRHLAALVPTANTAGMTTWMGFRPTLPDYLPALGRVPDGRNVFFAFGHQHLGLTLSGVTARIIADGVAGRDAGIDLAPFSPARFR